MPEVVKLVTKKHSSKNVGRLLKIITSTLSVKGLPIKKIPKNFLWCGTKSLLIIKDRQDLC
jgi:hypothetical protein